MNLPAAVIAAMALCNQHIIALRATSLGFTTASSSTRFSPTLCYDSYVAVNGIVPGSCPKETEQQKKEREDTATAYRFNEAYAWEAPYQDKCKTIQDYVAKVQASIDKKVGDKKAAEDASAKAAEQPTLDKGIAALPAIEHLQR